MSSSLRQSSSRDIAEMPSMGNYNCFQIIAQNFDTSEVSDQPFTMVFLRKKERYTYSEGTLSVLGLIAEPLLQSGNLLSIFV